MNEQTNDKTVDFKDVKRRMKIEQIKRKVFATIENNAHIIVPAVGALLLKAVKDVYRDSRKRKEERNVNSRVYDRRMDSWSEATRPLTAREGLELDRRYAAGERKKEILAEWGILKW